MKKAVVYLRVSTDKQGKSGLGLDAQRSAVREFLRDESWSIVEEHVEVESGRKSDRPELERAFANCRIHSAILVLAKLDRLSRDAHFLLGMKNSGIDFVCVDMPSANRVTISILSIVAEEEARLISVRTRAALQQAKARGTRLGNPKNLSNEARACGRAKSATVRALKSERRLGDLAPIVMSLRQTGHNSYSKLAMALNERSIPAPRGGNWSPAQVHRLMTRFNHT